MSNRSKLREIKHTPTPWKARKSPFRAARGENPSAVEIAGPTDHILAEARTSGAHGADAEGNADMIVRAVNSHQDLLAACRTVVERWEQGDLAEAVRLCAAAVAKVEGRRKTDESKELDCEYLDTGEEYQAQYDDDPNPYHGDYSEE